MLLIGLCSSECLLRDTICNVLIFVGFSKKSKIQSHGLAPAILEGLMPITTEEEPEDADDDAPCRVRLFVF